MRTREPWRRGLRLGKGAMLELHNARRRAQSAGEDKYDQRLRAILLVGQERLTQEEVAKVFEVTASCITRWVMLYVKKGVSGLRPLKQPGRKARLSPKQLQRLRRIISNGPEDYGLDTGVWTGPIVRDLILKRFRVEYSVEQSRRILHKLGFSIQYPKQVLSEASLAEQERWLRKTYPAIKKKRRGKEASSSSKTRRPSSNQAQFIAPGPHEGSVPKSEANQFASPARSSARSP